MDLEAERARRRTEIVRQVRQKQQLSGHDSPIPAFLNTVTDMIIDIELRLERLEIREEERAGS